MWLGKQHKEALATLKYGILDNKGFLLLTGDVGTGKTTLINTLIQSLADDVIYASVPDPSLSKLDFFNYIAFSFGIEQEFSTKGAFLAHFRKFLLDAYVNKKKVLLIIDESQLLTQELLEEIRLLSNIEKTNTKLINIFFVGQNELNKFLRQEKNRAVRQRLSLNYNIDPLTPDETDKYIHHRLKVAGVSHVIFNSYAVQEVFMYSGGFPRRINVICDQALLTGYVKEKKIIGANIVQECAKELKIPIYVKNRDINEFENHTPKPIPNIQSQSVVLKPKQPEKKKNWIGKVLTGIIIFFLFFSICWWVIFPISFQPKKEDNPNSTENMIIIEKPYVPTTKLGNIDKNNISPIIEKPQDANKSANEARADASNQLSEVKKILPLPEETINVRFKFDTNTPTEEGYIKLKIFTDVLIMHPNTKILIAGYTDTDGSQRYNLKLSEFRANIIKSFLLAKGVEPDQIESKGFGSLNPVESNETSLGRMMNRRVEIKILK